MNTPPFRILISENFAYEMGAQFIDDYIEKYAKMNAEYYGWKRVKVIFGPYQAEGSLVDDWRSIMPMTCDAVFKEDKQ